MRVSLILLVAMGAIMVPSAQASAPITHGPGARQHAVNLSPGVSGSLADSQHLAASRPLAVSQTRIIPRPMIPAAQDGSDPTCAAGVGCGTSVTFTVTPRKPPVVPTVPVAPVVPKVPVTG